jgi:hypothetical protein
MAYVRTAIDPREFSSTSVSTIGRFWRRVLGAMMRSRQRQAEREIALYLHSVGGKFTDDAEREIERRFLSNQL